MNIAIVTLFPEMFSALTEYGVSSRAVKQGIVHTKCWNPRDFTRDKHRTVDDRPYGGGPGMLMKTEPIVTAIEAAKVELTEGDNKPKVLCLSPQGKRLEQSDVASLAKEQSLILLCGRYEGIDDRVIQTQVDEEYSLGDYVISGGELAAMVLMDAMIRLQPEALGHEDSAAEDSFSSGLLDYPHYTRPEEFAGHKVPQVLLSGDHVAIARWRLKQSLGRTWLRRPDLLQEYKLDDEQRVLLDEFIKEQENQDSE
jgi:tRNA (guanine37-N1)-methyltransferase